VLIGILSDTHDRVEAMRAGMSALQSRGAEYFIHCGDVGGQGVLDLLAGLPSAVVWGNNDYDVEDLTQYATKLGVGIFGHFASLILAGKKIAVTHGDDFRLMSRLESGKQYDYLFHGHTHAARDQRMGTLRIINPGALYRTSRKSVALLDLSNDKLEFLPISV
jgi:putative phosphoesterase